MNFALFAEPVREWVTFGTVECPDGWVLLHGGNEPERVHRDLSGMELHRERTGRTTSWHITAFDIERRRP